MTKLDDGPNYRYSHQATRELKDSPKDLDRSLWNHFVMGVNGSYTKFPQ